VFYKEELKLKGCWLFFKSMEWKETIRLSHKEKKREKKKYVQRLKRSVCA